MSAAIYFNTHRSSGHPGTAARARNRLMLRKRPARLQRLEHISLRLNRGDSQRFVNERVWWHRFDFREQPMPKPYSGDLRARVIEEIATGASRREAAERYGISPS